MATDAAESEPSERILWGELRGVHGAAAREKLALRYQSLTRSIAARMYGGRIDDSVTYADYLQHGLVGLLEAMDRYDVDRGVAFSTFASARIRGAILNGLARESESSAQNRFWRTHVHDRVESLLTAVAPHADRVSLADIATVTVGLALGVFLGGSEDEFEPADVNPSNNPYAANEQRQLHLAIKSLLPRLPEKERFVIDGHYVGRIEFQRLAEQMGVTKGRVAQIHAQALLRLRAWLEERPNLDRKL